MVSDSALGISTMRRVKPFMIRATSGRALARVKVDICTWVDENRLPASDGMNSNEWMDRFNLLATNWEASCTVAFSLSNAAVDSREPFKVLLEAWTQGGIQGIAVGCYVRASLH
jgi:hypothetical protein